jgi:hypothetical protein
LKTIGQTVQRRFDFKPYRTLSKKEITGNATNEPWFDNLESEIEIHTNHI